MHKSEKKGGYSLIGATIHTCQEVQRIPYVGISSIRPTGLIWSSNRDVHVYILYRYVPFFLGVLYPNLSQFFLKGKSRNLLKKNL